jgi:prepilin-type N-terminal cleavage/methylation domain-containing protein
MSENRQNGFTIIELMIATTVFSLVLMVCLGGVMQITKMYYRAVTQAKTREAARLVVDEISEAIRFSNQDIIIAPPVAGPQVAVGTSSTSYICIGHRRYSYAIDRQVKSSPAARTKEQRNALWQDQPATCNGAADLTVASPSVDGKSLLGENMRLYDFGVKLVDPVQRIYEVRVGIAYGDDDLLNVKTTDASQLTCEGAFVGVEFCATTNFLVTVQKRL